MVLRWMFRLVFCVLVCRVVLVPAGAGSFTACGFVGSLTVWERASDPCTTGVRCSCGFAAGSLPFVVGGFS